MTKGKLAVDEAGKHAVGEVGSRHRQWSGEM